MNSLHGSRRPLSSSITCSLPSSYLMILLRLLQIFCLRVPRRRCPFDDNIVSVHAMVSSIRRPGVGSLFPSITGFDRTDTMCSKSNPVPASVPSDVGFEGRGELERGIDVAEPCVHPRLPWHRGERMQHVCFSFLSLITMMKMMGKRMRMALHHVLLW